ncbi:sulfite exporter TauE/SafE family protein [Rhabdothermincola sp.]|uniref:sulfite exporter TauE/SafE family protein n=1 Tax=Rhabdothermincola sp. TaxID=2820405 RepID=UPI002FE3E416
MAPWPSFVIAGIVVGLLMGVFGVGGSSVATPLLAILGVPGLIAVASPLPATIPSALVAATPYARSGESRPRAAAWSLVGGVPAAIVGGLLSQVIGGPVLLVMSGVVLIVIGVRVLFPISEGTRTAGTARRQNRPLLVATMAGIGLFTGLLANGGGFLLVPVYLFLFGLRMRQAVGTSLLVIAVMSIPTLATHMALGHIDWTVAGTFAAGLLPGAAIGARLAQRLEGPTIRRAFGWFLVVFGVAFTLYRLSRS